jgi:hypothetical protein
MFQDAKHLWLVGKLQKARRRTLASYKRIVRDAEAAGKSEIELDRLFFEERIHIQNLDAEIHHLSTERLIRLADRLSLPRPEFSTKGGAWVQSSASQRWHLSVEAMAELRSAIRREQKERSEHWRMWLTALTGLIGTLIGLVALLLKK